MLQLRITNLLQFLVSPLLDFLLKHGLTHQPFLHGFRWDYEVLSTT